MATSVNLITKRFLAVSISKKSVEKQSTRIPPKGFNVNPYALFLKEQYEKIPETKRQGNFLNMTKDIASKWKSMTILEKKVYADESIRIRQEKIAQFEKLSEEEKKEILAKTLQDKEEKRRRKIRKEKREMFEKTNHPARPSSSYMLFTKEQFDKLKEKGEKITPVYEIAKTLKTKWDNLSAAEKEKYTAKANALRDAYKVQLEEWKKKNPTPSVH